MRSAKHGQHGAKDSAKIIAGVANDSLLLPKIERLSPHKQLVRHGLRHDVLFSAGFHTFFGFFGKRDVVRYGIAN